MTIRSHIEVRADYEKQFGEKDGAVVHLLETRTYQLVQEWSFFLYLFCGPKERVGVLNEASGSTAVLLQTLLWNSTLLAIRRFTDAPRSSRNKAEENLSLKRLVEIAKIANVDLDVQFAVLCEGCSKARVHATKYVAHNDLGHALGRDVSEVTRNETTAAVKAITLFVSKFHEGVRDTTVSFRLNGSSNGYEYFLMRLHQGNKAAEAEKNTYEEMRRSGKLNFETMGQLPSWIWESDPILDR